jgi:hypothetical protein
MNERTRERLSVWSDRAHLYRFRILLASLILFLVIVPLTIPSGGFSPLPGIMLSLVVLAGLLSVRRERLLLGVALLLGVPILLSRWAGLALPSVPYSLVQVLIPISFFVFFTVFLLWRVVTCDEVTGNVIAGALSVYLLLGLTWSLAYQGLSMVTPGAFSVGTSIADRGPLAWMDFLYYSFITLATVGYGDITPVVPLAQSLAYAEAVTGVLYVAVLVERLVSAYQRPAHPPPRAGP